MNGVRSFVAVSLPPEIQRAIFEVAQGLAGPLPDVKWLRKVENLHITLRFLGRRIDAGLLDRFAAALAEALAALPGFRIGLRGMGAFPSERQASIIWAGVEDPLRDLERVAAVVAELARRFGLAFEEERPFRGHVTVGRTTRRARHGVDVRTMLEPWRDHRFGEIWVGEVHLYESVLGGDGSTYVLRGKATLEGATDGDRQEREQGTN
jgi:2'-5' RNA ligase